MSHTCFEHLVGKYPTGHIVYSADIPVSHIYWKAWKRARRECKPWVKHPLLHCEELKVVPVILDDTHADIQLWTANELHMSVPVKLETVPYTRWEIDGLTEDDIYQMYVDGLVDVAKKALKIGGTI